MGEKLFNLSEQIEHNRNLVREGKAEADYAEKVNNWLMRVDARMQMTGEDFTTASAFIPPPMKGYTSEDSGSYIQPPNAFVARPDGAELIFPDEE